MKAEFLILGALHRGDLHPYEIKRRLENALVECYTDVDVGTLYYAVRQLAKPARSLQDVARKSRAAESAPFIASLQKEKSVSNNSCWNDFVRREVWPRPSTRFSCFFISPPAQP